MDDGGADKNRYFREVTRAFLRLRGAPFILSARELHVLASWEKERIPLETVLAGLERAFQRRGTGAPAGRTRTSLVFCDSFVRRAYDQHRERAVGGRRPEREKTGRKERIRREAAAFLDELPEELSYLESLFRRALRLVEAEGEHEEDLERLEREVESALWERSPADERERAGRKIRKEAPASGGEPSEEKVRARLIKDLRVRYRIPFVSCRYY